MNAYEYNEDLELSLLNDLIEKHKVRSFKSKAGAAKALYKALCEYCNDLGIDPDDELGFWSPEESDDGNWKVSLEAGPYRWACGLFLSNREGGWYCEAGWSFDLSFIG